MKKMNIRRFTAIGLLSSVSYLFMLLNFPIPPFPGFLMVDFSEVPALIAAIVYGPVAGILVELLKNVLNYIMLGSPTGVPIGHIANFVAGLTFILPTYFVYNKIKSKKGMTLALIVGTAVMALLMSILNYYIILPSYTIFMNAPAMSAPETKALVITAILPFNAIKGFIVAVVFMLIFTRMDSWLQKQMVAKGA
ncbi:riboflavin transporter FmnP [Oikeobacillus pervagus]|uniref:Riboflavin transporter n=1 Tax=Oikeobacillus pervagus TaxID=1325931 RepID=A0AAJ1SYM0_9BACI|nr:ECF transporter S component [Oikeobacillus pervagus]MDQ0213731.1 riboflavin transporter FmnP [Oikeobacillus pervagus]